MTPYGTNQYSSHQRYFISFLHFASFTLLYLCGGFGWYFGNLIVYLNSFWYARQDSAADSTSQWVISVNMICWSLSTVATGIAVKKVDRRLLCVLGLLLTNAGLFLSHLTVDFKSRAAFVVTMGGMTGVGVGCISTDLNMRVAALVKQRIGLAFAVLHNTFNIGAMGYNWISTWYINPQNKRADILVLGEEKVFSEMSVINRVPNVFLVLGILTLACQVPGCILTILLNDRGLDVKEIVHDVCITKAREDSTLAYKATLVENASGTNSNKMISQKQYHTYESIPCRQHMTSSQDGGPYSSGRFDRAVVRNQVESEASDDAIESIFNNTDLTHIQMLKDVTFYVVWFVVFANDVTLIVFFNFSKVFGELWFPNDHFITQMGIAALFIVIGMRLSWALVMDRVNPKTTQVIITSAMSLTYIFYFFTPSLGVWGYAAWTCIIAGLNSSVYVNCSFMTLRLFGQTHFAANFGIMSTATLATNFLAPLIFNPLLRHWGWPVVFIGAGGLNALALITIVALLPYKR